MTFQDYNPTQFAEVESTIQGVTFVYTDSKGREFARAFYGKDFTIKDLSDDEQFRVWKAVITIHWDTKIMEMIRQVDNSGISAKLKGKTPERIIFRGVKKEVVCRYDVMNSPWEKIGLMPGKKEVAVLKWQTPGYSPEKDRKWEGMKHRAAVSSYNTLGLRKKDYVNVYVDPTDEKETKKNEATEKATKDVADAIAA